MFAEAVLLDPSVWIDRGLALGLAAAVLWWLMKRFDKLDQERIDRAKKSDEEREKSSAALVNTMGRSLELLSTAVARFETFEREERQSHQRFAEGLQRITESQVKFAEVVAVLRTSMNELSQKHDTWARTTADFIQELREIRNQRRDTDPPS